MTSPCLPKCFKTRPEIIKRAVMSYIRYPLSLHRPKGILHEGGMDLCHETERFWWNRFGPFFALEIRRRRANLHASRWWHVDEVLVRINDARLIRKALFLRALCQRQS